MSELDDIRRDIGILIDLVKERPTRTEMVESEGRVRDDIRAEIHSFGTTIAAHVGGVLQRVEAIELRRDNEAAAAARNGRPRPARVR